MCSPKAASLAGRKSQRFISVKDHEFCYRTMLHGTHWTGNKCNVILSSS